VKLEDHPTVRRLLGGVEDGENQQPAKTALNGAWLRRLARDCGADDAGLVEISRAGSSRNARKFSEAPRSLLSFVLRMAREPVRGAPQSVANLGGAQLYDTRN
jgi:hypothetical protein